MVLYISSVVFLISFSGLSNRKAWILTIVPNSFYYYHIFVELLFSDILKFSLTVKVFLMGVGLHVFLLKGMYRLRTYVLIIVRFIYLVLLVPSTFQGGLVWLHSLDEYLLFGHGDDENKLMPLKSPLFLTNISVSFSRLIILLYIKHTRWSWSLVQE